MKTIKGSTWHTCVLIRDQWKTRPQNQTSKFVQVWYSGGPGFEQRWCKIHDFKDVFNLVIFFPALCSLTKSTIELTAKAAAVTVAASEPHSNTHTHTRARCSSVSFDVSWFLEGESFHMLHLWVVMADGSFGRASLWGLGDEWYVVSLHKVVLIKHVVPDYFPVGIEATLCSFSPINYSSSFTSWCV